MNQTEKSMDFTKPHGRDITPSVHSVEPMPKEVRGARCNTSFLIKAPTCY
ncbi:hypothetical protein JN06_00720 [Bacteroides zoogleoformans]|nr:hypothetical protein JN06_00720 [Bacteroides zoogleoformans]